MHSLIKIILCALFSCLITGCSGSNAITEGKMTITDTKAFSNNKAIKSPPPQKPTQ